MREALRSNIIIFNNLLGYHSVNTNNQLIFSNLPGLLVLGFIAVHCFQQLTGIVGHRFFDDPELPHFPTQRGDCFGFAVRCRSGGGPAMRHTPVMVPGFKSGSLLNAIENKKRRARTANRFLHGRKPESRWPDPLAENRPRVKTIRD